MYSRNQFPLPQPPTTGWVELSRFDEPPLFPGLYAVGNSQYRVHGANRLASNSLLECIVFGAQMANIEID